MARPLGLVLQQVERLQVESQFSFTSLPARSSRARTTRAATSFGEHSIPAQQQQQLAAPTNEAIAAGDQIPDFQEAAFPLDPNSKKFLAPGVPADFNFFKKNHKLKKIPIVSEPISEELAEIADSNEGGDGTISTTAALTIAERRAKRFPGLQWENKQSLQEGNGPVDPLTLQLKPVHEVDKYRDFMKVWKTGHVALER